jgi:hypothetical protein
MTLYVDGEWNGWQGDTIIQLSDGSVWRQSEYVYEYHYAYRPEATFIGTKLKIEGMHSVVEVRQI